MISASTRTTVARSRYYSFSLANFIAAFGGGMILGKGMSALTTTFIQGGSILAFFVGTTLGLIFLQCVPKQWSTILAHWFAICSGITSLILLSIFANFSVNGMLPASTAVLFFALLSMRFGFWFYSRVFRAAAVAGQQQRIAWVEFGYYAGIIAGLIIWECLGVTLNMETALIIDTILQFIAGFFDLFANFLYRPLIKHDAVITKKQPTQDTQPSSVNSLQQEDWHTIKWGWRLTSAAVLLTIGIQVVTFNLANQVAERFGSYILAFFYIGVASAAIVCSKLKIQLAWQQNKNISYAIICYGQKNAEQKISFFWISLLSACCVILAAIGTHCQEWGTFIVQADDLLLSMVGIGEILLLAFVSIAAFFYEILTLSILDRIGLEDTQTCHYQGMVVRAYGLMGIGTVVSFWILALTNNSPFFVCSMISLCSLLAVLAIRRRHCQSACKIRR